ncbi:MAG: succinate--CoA ligase subunit beta [Rivularia sp. (in: Bacteria)]|nr:succinate--CoA ligase subunit beta [Rivularia sp. MS3]
MELLEYQVKEWFGKIGIPVLPSQTIDHPTDLKRLKINYPIVLKSQIYGGGRAKAGGVRFVETTIDAIATAQNIFNLSIYGELPELLLAEAKYNIEQELYLAIVLDTAVCRPILLGCNEADIDWDEAGEKMQHVVVEEQFSPFYARRLALKMGLQGTLMQSVSEVIENMYRLFIEKDLDLVEINPLGVNSSGQVMALNGNVSINERAIRRHQEIALIARKLVSRNISKDTNGNFGNWDGVEKHGRIGVLGNGAGSVMATLDLVVNNGGKPGVCLNLRHAFLTDIMPTTFNTRLQKALQILAADKSIKVILINFLGSIPQAKEVAEVIAGFIQQQSSSTSPNSQEFVANGNKNGLRGVSLPRLVIRLAGSDLDTAKNCLSDLTNAAENSILLVESLDEAVERAVKLAKENVKRQR